MKTSPPLSSLRFHAGFSLIELLVVLFIISLMAGIVAVQINLGGDQGAEVELQEHIEDLLLGSHLAEDQAVLTGLPYGLFIEQPTAEHDWRLQWLRYQRREWQEADEPFVTQDLPRSIEVVTEVEGNVLEFDNLLADDSIKIPAIVFYPGGEVTPFNMTFYSTDDIEATAVISSELTGRVEQVEDDDYLHAFN